MKNKFNLKKIFLIVASSYNVLIAMEENTDLSGAKFYIQAMTLKGEKKLEKFNENLKKAADLNHSDAQYELGKEYLNKALSFFQDIKEDIADIQYARICFDCGNFYKKRKKIEEANLYYAKIEKLGYFPAKKELAAYYLNLAKELFQKCVDSGNKESQDEIDLVSFLIDKLQAESPIYS